ncbi:MAG: thioredoxin family protein [Akkermansia sp.]|nr:thioredoxin family protein [Akkermansia sp.]
MKHLFFLFILLCAPLSALTEFPSPEEALAATRSDGRCIMLNFTGTDWCTACIHLRTEILDSEEFNKAMNDKLVLVEVDYPRSPELVQKISPEERKKREALLISYRAEGLPYAVLLDAQGYPFATLSGTSRTTADYLPRLEKAFETLRARNEALNRAQGLTGPDYARALADALNLLPEACRDKYPDLLQKITENDPNDTLGYRRYYRGSEARIRRMAELRELLATFRGQFEPRLIRGHIAALDEFLSQENLDAGVRQEALRAKADSYAFLRDIPSMLRTMKEAHAVSPESRTGKKLEQNIRYTEDVILPMWQESQKAPSVHP